MDNKELIYNLKELSDKKYGDFHSKLVPDIKRETILGVKVPVLRSISKLIIKDEYYKEFINCLPHCYYEENMLHGLLINLTKDYNECIRLIEEFLPFIDNWAVCDAITPKIFVKNKDKLLIRIKEWIKSEKEYTVRFAVEMLMKFFLDEDYKKEYIDLINEIKIDTYYVNMMVAWFLATALSKQWDTAIKKIESKTLSPFIQNKTIQKSIESFRIRKEQKDYLKTLKY